MKKTLVALAALAATASFADVVLTGTFDPTVVKTSTTYGNNAVANQTNMTYNGRGTSQITFKVSEDLGGGLTAIALMENDFQAQNKEDQYGQGADQGAGTRPHPGRVLSPGFLRARPCQSGKLGQLISNHPVLCLAFSSKIVALFNR